MQYEIIVGASSLVVGVIIGAVFSRSNLFTEFLGFVMLGLLVGLILGLSASPILGAAISAISALVGTAISTFGKIKGISSRLQLGFWLLPFSLFAAVGLLGGITLRVNDALNFSQHDLRTKYRALGFTDTQVEGIMDKLASSVSSMESADQSRTTDLLRKEEKLSLQDLHLNDHDLIDHVEALGPEAEKLKVTQWRNEKKTEAEIANLIKKDLGLDK